jgi:hypothetical protein
MTGSLLCAKGFFASATGGGLAWNRSGSFEGFFTSATGGGLAWIPLLPNNMRWLCRATEYCSAAVAGAGV